MEDDDCCDDDMDDDQVSEEDFPQEETAPTLVQPVNDDAAEVSSPPAQGGKVKPKGGRRNKVIPATKKLSAAEMADGALYEPIGIPRPVTRGDCKEDERPCPWVGCKHHLYLDVDPNTGSIKLNFPDLEVWELEHSCALDKADLGGITLEEVGEVMNLTRERVRQVETRGLLRLKQLTKPDAEGWPLTLRGFRSR